jgi:predicted Zn-dependent peptidase
VVSAVSVLVGRAAVGVGAGISGTRADVQRTVLPNGLTVLSDNVPGVRSVAFGAWVRAATLHERAEKMGISHMLEHMVFKGTEKRSAKEISLALETLGGSLDA